MSCQYLEEKINHFKLDLTNKPTRAHQCDISPESTRAGLLDAHNFVWDRGFLTLCELHKSEASTQETVNTTLPPWTTTIPGEKIHHNATRRRTHMFQRRHKTGCSSTPLSLQAPHGSHPHKPVCEGIMLAEKITNLRISFYFCSQIPKAHTSRNQR